MYVCIRYEKTIVREQTVLNVTIQRKITNARDYQTLANC